MTRRHFVLVGLVLALGGPIGLVLQKEHQLRTGAQVFLRLAPVDPRSLMEGDYMRLEYAASRAAAELESDPDGYVVLTVDSERRATFNRFDHGESLGVDEVRLRYRRRHAVVKLGSDAFYFQEGDAQRYSSAKFGEVRVTGGGDAVLAGLRDEQLRPLGRPQP
jgi:uncharacterized membrane-anchored protein